MPSRVLTILVLVLIPSLTGCSGLTPSSISTPTSTSEVLARETLIRFFFLLHSQDYHEASLSYGGSYATMIEHNPDLDPSDKAALLRGACEINGAACLEIYGSPTLETVSNGEFSFRVQFARDDGSILERGQCCGGSGPTENSFLITVKEVSPSEFVVMSSPIYLP